MSRHPNFRFLILAFEGNKLEIVEGVAKGDRTNPEIQRHIPGAELISLNRPDIEGGLALAYNRTELFIRGHLTQRLLEVSEVEHFKSSPSRDGEFEYIKRRIRSAHTPIIRTAREDRRRLKELGIEPISPERMRYIVGGLIDKTEAFLSWL